MMAALGGMTTAHRVGAARSCVRDRAGSHVRACARPSAGFGRNARPLVLCQARPSKPQKVGSSPSPGGVAPKHLNQASAVAVRALHPTSPDHHTIPTYPTARSRPFAVHGPRRPRAARLGDVARLGRLTLIRLIEATCKAKPPFRKFQSTSAHRLSPTNHNRTPARRARSTRATLTSARATARRNPAPRTSPSQHESPSA